MPKLTPTQAQTVAAMENAASLSTQGRSLWQDARRRFLSNPATLASLILLASMVSFAVLYLAFGPHDVITQYRDRPSHPPTLDNWHLFGTDLTGRDMVARLSFGLIISILVGLAATSVSLVIGLLWGAIAGFAGGKPTP